LVKIALLRGSLPALHRLSGSCRRSLIAYAMPAEPDRRLYCKTGFGLKSKPLGEEDNAKLSRRT
jgi:hypothetical protein